MEEKKNRASRDSMGGGGMGGFSDRPPMGRGERGSQVRAFVSLEQGQHWWWWYGADSRTGRPWAAASEAVRSQNICFFLDRDPGGGKKKCKEIGK